MPSDFFDIATELKKSVGASNDNTGVSDFFDIKLKLEKEEKAKSVPVTSTTTTPTTTALTFKTPTTPDVYAGQKEKFWPIEKAPKEEGLKEGLFPSRETILNLVSPTKTGLVDVLLRPKEAKEASRRELELISKPYKTLKPEEQKELTERMFTIGLGILGETPKAKLPGIPLPTVFSPEKYVKELTGAREAARKVATPGLMEKATGLYKEARRKLIDLAAPIEDTLIEATKKSKITLLPKDNITNQIDRVLRAPTLGGEFAERNGLVKIIKDVDNLDNLDQYMIAKQARNVEKLGIKTGRDLTKDAQLIDAFKDKYEVPAQAVTAYSRNLLDYVAETGLISKKTVDGLKIKYPEYVPLNRVFSEIELEGMPQGVGIKPIASLSKQTVVQKLVGSEREIENPIKSLLEKTHIAFVQGERNKAARILAGYEKLPGNPFNLRELGAGEKAQHTISFLDNGAKRVFETTQDIAEAAKRLNVQQLNVLEQIMAIPVRIAKVGITGLYTPFIASNITKDQAAAFINSKEGLATSLANPANFLKSFMSVVKHDDLYKEMVRNAGGGTSFDIARNQALHTIEEIRSTRGIGVRAKYLVRHPSELIRAVEDIVGRSEELTRMTQYAGTKQALLKKGVPPEEAMIEAARAARENSANFYRRGEWGNVLNSTFLYLNAAKEGTRALIRSFRRQPIQTSAKIVATIFLPEAMATIWNLSDPTRKAVYDDIQSWEKQNNFIIVPPNPTKDEKDRWNVIKAPKPFELAYLSNLVRRGIEQAYGGNPIKAKEALYYLTGTVSVIDPSIRGLASSFTPQIIKPALEAMTNVNFYTGSPIVPRKLEKVSPELQVKPKTSGTVRLLSKPLGLSPIQTENFIRETFGGLGTQIIQGVDVAAAKAGLIPKEQVGGESIQEGILRRFTKAYGGGIEEGTEESLKKRLTRQADIALLTEQQAQGLIDLSKKDKESAIAQFKQLPPARQMVMYKKIKGLKEDEKLGLTYEDHLIKQLQVKNGERARYIYETAKEMKTAEERIAYANDLLKKKLLTVEIIKQIGELKTK